MIKLNLNSFIKTNAEYAKNEIKAKIEAKKENVDTGNTNNQINDDLPETSYINTTTFCTTDTANSLLEGVKYVASHISADIAPAYAVYTANGKYELSDISKKMNEFQTSGKNGAAGWDLQVLLERAESLNSTEKSLLNDYLKEYADFMTTEEYKNYATSENIVPEEEKENVINCLDLCDYMNYGYSVTPNTQLFDENSNWKEAESIKNTETGFYGEVFVNEETKELIIGYCGTNDMEDATTDDLDMMLKAVPDQYNDALNLYKKYADDPQYADYKISITGHSLGASLAELVAATDGVSNSENPPTAVTFNAFGTYEIIENNKDSEEYNFVEQNTLDDAKVYNYITEGDLVCCTTKHVGQTMYVENQSPIGHMTTSIHLSLTPEEYDIGKSKITLAKNTIKKVFSYFKK